MFHVTLPVFVEACYDLSLAATHFQELRIGQLIAYHVTTWMSSFLSTNVNQCQCVQVYSVVPKEDKPSTSSN